nr:MAG TPA: hypothetical protein [Ackermannviridae sp.]
MLPIISGQGVMVHTVLIQYRGVVRFHSPAQFGA